MRIALISCVQKKANYPCEARLLYQSALFKKAYVHAVKHFDKVFILSAKHGLVEPEQIISPYEKNLHRMRLTERRLWAIGVHRQLAALLKPDDVVYFFAGIKYTELLSKMLPCPCEIPLKGLDIGYQLQWYNEHG